MASSSITTTICEEQLFECPTCKEQVPERNRIVHSVTCPRHKPQVQDQNHTQEEEQQQQKQQQLEETDLSNETNSALVAEIPVVSLDDTQPSSPATVDSPHLQFPHDYPQPCPFCELYDSSPDHVAICGARTDQCAACNRRVRKRDWGLHQDSNCVFGATTEAPIIEAPTSDVDTDSMSETEPLLGNSSSIPSAASLSNPALIAAVAAGAAAIGYSMLFRRRR